MTFAVTETEYRNEQGALVPARAPSDRDRPFVKD